jgi:prepilin-type N-terminal cleavage/methylation domain-containing protein
MNFRRKVHAFTLVEIMIVVLILGIIAAIAVPSWIQSRDRSRRMTCLANMRTMEDAKDLYAISKRLASGAAVDEAELFNEYIKGGVMPICPSNGNYTLNVIGTSVACTTHGQVNGSAE